MPLAVCATPIGNLEDVTLRVLEELRSADVVLCEDTRHTRVLLDRHGIEATLVSYHEHNERRRARELIERVRAGELRPIVVDDQAGSVAHAHAEIRVSGWDVMVVDAGSRNGTYVSGPDEGRWTPLPPRRSRRLLPGTRVRLGDGRTFVFESSSTVR